MKIYQFLVKSYRFVNLLVVLALVLGAPLATIAKVWTDPTDYSPGSTVWIQGDNSDGAAYLIDELVHVEVTGPVGEDGQPYTAWCEDQVEATDPNNPDYLYWTCPVTLWDSLYAVGTYTYTATGLTSGVVEEGTFTDGLPEISPLRVAKWPGETQQFTVSGGKGPYTFSLLVNESGGSITSDGLYTAGGSGTGTDIIDTVLVTDANGGTGKAWVYVGDMGNGETVINGCMGDVAGTDLNCTAEDVRIASVTNIVIEDDGCTAPGDMVTFTADYAVLTGATERYDIGLYFAIDGDPNGDGAYTGECSISTLPYMPDPPYLDLDGTVAGVQDTCGDVGTKAHSDGIVYNPVYHSITLTVECQDVTGDGFLDLPYCTSWRNLVSDLCTSPLDAFPSEKSKCNCEEGYSVPVPVPGQINVDKVTDPSEASASFEFTLTGSYVSPHDGTTVVDVNQSFSLTDGAEPWGSDYLYAGTYSVVETPLDGWTPTGVTCANEDGDPEDPANILLDAGEIVTCTFYNLLKIYSLNVDKSSTTSEITAVGQVVPYTFVVTNTGNQPLTGITVSDPMCDADTLAYVSGDENADDILDLSETWSYTCSHKVTLEDATGGDYLNNTVTVSSNESDPATDTLGIPITYLPLIHVEKTSTTSSVTEAGQVVDYNFQVTNQGNVPLTGVTVTDAMCDEAPVYVSGDEDSDNTLDLSETWSYTCSHTVTQAEINVGGNLSNTVTADSNESEPDTDDYYISITQSPAIDIQKTPDTQTVIDGQTATFTILVTNTGNVPLTGVTVSDPLALNCDATIGELAVGESMSYTCTFSPVTASFTNVAYASGYFGSTEVTDNDSAAVVVDILPDISITKTASPTSVPETGADVTFTFVVTNHASEPFILNSLTDTVFSDLDGQGTCDVPVTIAGGGTYTCAVTKFIASDTLTDHYNVATATGVDEQGNPDSASDDETVDVTDVAPEITITKTASPTSVLETGGDVTFTFLVENIGQEDVTLNSLVDTKFGDLDGKGTCDVPQNILIGGSYSCEYTVFLSSDSLTAHTNVVTATAVDDDGTQASDTDDETVTFTDVAPDISITKTADPTHVPETGGDVTFTFLVENIGQEDVTLTSLTDSAFGDLNGQGDCVTGGLIPVGGSYSCSITVFLSADDLVAHTNVVTAVGTDDDGSTDTATDDETVTFDDVAPDISITKTANPTHVPETGGDVTFTFVVSNDGVEDVTLTTLSDSVFGDLNGQGDCVTGGLIAIGGSYSCSITVFLSSDSLTAHTNVVTATAVDDDNTQATDTDDETVTFDDVMPTVDLTKTADPLTLAEPGGDFVFTLSIHNTSPEAVMITSLTDTNALSEECLALIDTSIPAGGTVFCTYTVSHTEAGSYDNTASVTVTDNEGNPANDNDSETVTVTDVLPTVDLTKSVDSGGTFNVGDTATFTLLIENTSLEAVTITTLTDDYALSQDCLDLIGTSIPAGESVSCTYTVVIDTAGTYPNTASVTVEDNETNPVSDTDDETVTFYVPTISKTALGTYDEVHDWEIFKTTGSDIKRFAGQNASYSWTVRVDETTHGENYLVTGVITIVNPNPDDAITLTLSDMLDDGSEATIIACAVVDGNPLVQNADDSWTIPANSTVTCDYSAEPTGDLDNFAAALPATVLMDVVYPGPDSYFLTNIYGGTLAGTYEGWCVDTDHYITPGTDYTANVYSSFETLPDGLVEHPENFDQVNWIINYGFVGKTSPSGGVYTYGDVQRAIWELVEDVVTADISYIPSHVAEIRALALANGVGFVPTCGDMVAVVLQPVSLTNQVITIAQVTFASLNASCADSNTVTAVINGQTFSATEDIIWTANPINPTAVLDDLQNPAWPITVSSDLLVTYTDPQLGYLCPSDPALYAGDGIAPVYTDSNTATLTYDTGSKSATDSINVTCYAPVMSKTAVTTWVQTYDWSITKTADPTTHTGFAGDSFTSSYDVVVDQTIADAYSASGVISIKNPAGSPGSMTVNVADMVSGDIAATVDCDPLTEGNQTSVTVATNTTKTCSYAVTLPDSTTRVNTATGTFNNIAFPATAEVVFGSAPTSIVGYPTINVTDSYAGALGTASGDFTFEYDRTFSCSTNAADYTAYADSDVYGNTATIDETGASDDASVTVNCYIPEISKAAAGVYDERHDWDVTKTASPALQSAFIGETVSYQWTVTVVETVYEENFVASGTITILNHNPEDAMTVALTDVLSDGTVATITACTGDADLSDGLTIAANGSSVCDYSASLKYSDVNLAPTNNTATLTLNNVSYSASDEVEWTATVIDASATLDDEQNPDFPLDNITEGGTWSYSEDFTCSTDKTLYDATTLMYNFSESNTATVVYGNLSDSASATASVDCYMPSISKDAYGTYDEVHDWYVLKTVNTASQNALAGQFKNFSWTVRVDETVHGEEYWVTGDILIVNPNPDDAMNIFLSDELDDGSVVAITACTVVDGDPLVQNADGSWTIPAGSTVTCDYEVEPSGDLDDFAAALPASVTINSTNPGPESYWLTTVSGGTSLDGVYEAWCVDIDNTMYPNTNYTAAVYSSYDFPTSLVEKYYNMDLVNWLINQDLVGTVSPGGYGIYTYGDVQRAIWELIEDNPTATTAGLGTWNQNRVDELEARAIAEGEGFEPTCGDFIAVLLVPVGGQQPIAIAQVTFASLGLDCATSNAVTAVLNGIHFPASADIDWTVTTFNETALLADDQNTGWPVTVDADAVFTYTDPQGYTCPTDPAFYTNGIYTYYESNTALLTYETGSDSSLASTKVVCYAPLIDKTAAGAYDERHEWYVEKTVDPLTQDILAGKTASLDWTVDVTETVTEENFVASGSITVKNPSPLAMVVKLSDVLSDGSVPTITGCTNGTWDAVNQTVSVAANTIATCAYTAELTYSDDDNAPTNNTVTAELIAGTTHLTTTASDAVEWTATVIRGSATLDDDLNNAFPLEITDSGTYNYTTEYTCSPDLADYTSGAYSETIANTAIITSGDERDSDSASSTVNCYYPLIAIDKVTFDGMTSGDGLTILSGEPIIWTYTVTNPGSVPLSNVSVTDSVTGVTPAYVSGDDGDGLLEAGETWIYEAAGTAVIGDYDNLGTATGSWTDDDGNTGTPSDSDGSSYFGANPNFTVAKDCASTQPIPQEGPAVFKVTFTNTGNVALSITADDDIGTFTLAVYETKSPEVTMTGPFSGQATVDNTVNASASYTDDAGHDWSAEPSDDASCRVGSRVNVKKTTNGAVDPSMTWTFSLYAGPDGFGGTQLATASTAADLDGVLIFNNVNLDSLKTYTLCEKDVAAGWTSVFRVDTNGDGIVDLLITNPTLYNPNADDEVPNDLGNRCVDFGAGTGLDLLTDGGTLRFEVDNTYPGGEPRTPGYWKNWNTCTGGGQQYTAFENGGWEEGFWLLDDVIAGKGQAEPLVWDDMLADLKLVPIDSCELGVTILSAYDIYGTNHNSDGAYTLAKHLLAAQLNYGAGARTCDAATDAQLAAEELLDKYDFDATGDSYLPSNSKDKKIKADYALALSLAATLDKYNNGLLCLGPSVSFWEPLDGAVVAGEVTLWVEAYDTAPVMQVEFFVDGVSVGVDTNGDDLWQIIDWDSTSVDDGSHVIKAVATNAGMNTGSANVTVIVDNGASAPPVVAITYPLNGATLVGSVNVTADASSMAGMSQVEFFANDISIYKDGDGSDGWSFTWDSTTVTDGAYLLKAVATASDGQTAEHSIAILVDNVEDPTITIASLTVDAGVWVKTGVIWKATVHVTVSPAVEGAVVTGKWSNGDTGTCTTDASGSCDMVNSELSKKLPSIFFTVENITLSGYVYEASLTSSDLVNKP